MLSYGAPKKGWSAQPARSDHIRSHQIHHQDHEPMPRGAKRRGGRPNLRPAAQAASTWDKGCVVGGGGKGARDCCCGGRCSHRPVFLGRRARMYSCVNGAGVQCSRRDGPPTHRPRTDVRGAFAFAAGHPCPPARVCPGPVLMCAACGVSRRAMHHLMHHLIGRPRHTPRMGHL